MAIHMSELKFHLSVHSSASSTRSLNPSKLSLQRYLTDSCRNLLAAPSQNPSRGSGERETAPLAVPHDAYHSPGPAQLQRRGEGIALGKLDVNLDQGPRPRPILGGYEHTPGADVVS